MTALEAAIKAKLTTSPDWTALVTGGTSLYEDLGINGLMPDNALYDMDGNMKLTAVLTFGTSSEAEILNSETEFFTLWLYHGTSFAAIKQARTLAKSLLNMKQVATDDAGYPLIRWVNNLADFQAAELNNAFAGGSRYLLKFTR